MPRAIGYVATAATTEAAVNATTYTEQTSGAQRSVKSSSASDAAAGTGARTIKITYYALDASGNIFGPFSETLTLNGLTAVPTVNTNIALIDRIELVTAGSGGVAAGTITLFTDNAGAGSAIASIATGDLRTYMAQAYVPNGRRLHVSDVVLDSGEAATVESAFRLRVLPYGGVSNPAEAAVGNGWRALGLSGVRQLDGGGRDLAVVSGPARVRLYVAPGAVTGTTQRGEFGYYLS